MIRCTSNAECLSTSHFIDCPKVPAAERAERYKGLYEDVKKSLNNNITIFTRLHEQVTFWQGKFRMVAHENNKLRRKAGAGIRLRPDPKTEG